MIFRQGSDQRLRFERIEDRGRLLPAVFQGPLQDRADPWIQAHPLRSLPDGSEYQRHLRQQPENRESEVCPAFGEGRAQVRLQLQRICYVTRPEQGTRGRRSRG